MSQEVPVSKDEDHQIPIPSEWRGTLAEVVEAFKEGDFGLKRGVAGVRSISAEKAAGIANNIRGYGARLTSLPEETWQSSACQWMRGHWDILVDLFTIEEGASDLVLAARVYEEDSTYVFEIQSVLVP
jgi:hypothetical protein